MKFQNMQKKLSPKQEALARRFQAAEITSYSKAVKAFASHDDTIIEQWKQELTAKTQPEPVAQPDPTPITEQTEQTELDYEFPFQAVEAAGRDPWVKSLGFYVYRKINGRFDYGHAGHGKLEEGEELWDAS